MAFNYPDVAQATHAAASKTPVLADELPISDSAASWAGKKTTVSGLGSAILADHFADDLTSGESTIPRKSVSNVFAPGNGIERLAYFTAKKTEVITQVRTVTSTQAQVGATLCRVAVYTVAANGDLTEVATTPNTTTLWLAQNTAYTTALSASFTKTSGQRYAVGVLVVGASQQPYMMGLNSLVASEAAAAPRLSGYVGSLSDLPSSPISAGSITDTGVVPYVVLLP